MVSRRSVLIYGIAGAPAIAAAGAMGGMWATTATRRTGEQAGFTNKLVIPPLAPSDHDREGRRVFNLRATTGTMRFRAGAPTETWGINGPYLGPTLRARRGETVLVNVRNDLTEATTMHWHGMHVPAAMDGGPHQLIAPGTTWSPSWTIRQPAATLWYHPHPHGRTARHVHHGLAGLFIIDENEALALPRHYGVDDIPVIVQDKRLNDDNQLNEEIPTIGGMGVLGDLITVNGTVEPYLDVWSKRVRLRLLNASNSRFYNFGMADDRSFALVGTDGGLLPAPLDTNRVQLSPGERAEIVVSLRPGERLMLRSYRSDLGINIGDQRYAGGGDILDILELRAASELFFSPPLPATLAERPRLDVSAPTARRRFELRDFKINGLLMDPGRIDVGVRKNTTEVWEIANLDHMPHNFHVHDVQFLIMSVDGGPPRPEVSGWKDTLYVKPGTRARIAMRFADYTDPQIPYMYHCHILWHEDQGMMGQFVVLGPGEKPGILPMSHTHGRGVAAHRRGAASNDRGAASHDRGAASHDRGPASHGRGPRR
ncbi:multicopper oxidase domain-containing protein [Nonomuraea sp. NPDC049152]|uniref:multicopper oxidase family protein n=1 Tax=Nonomuraea sp. NPDC049152 TaxID=3154350 RepID=UPI0033EE81FA